jgi:uncharacterized lipoprotein (TIGR02269 family)
MQSIVSHFLLPLLLAALSLSACATPSPALNAWEGTSQDDAACETPDADQCVVLACDEGVCGFFDCEDVDPEALTLAPLEHSVEFARGFRRPIPAPGSNRSWRRAGLQDDSRPRMTFHFRYRNGFLPAFPRLDGKLIKHHLFPQEPKLAAWFQAHGINIHEWTMLVPEHVHLRIHRGATGGLWNEAWRQYREENLGRRLTPEDLLRKAFELALRFDIAGPIRSYYGPIPPPGPQLVSP